MAQERSAKPVLPLTHNLIHVIHTANGRIFEAGERPLLTVVPQRPPWQQIYEVARKGAGVDGA